MPRNGSGVYSLPAGSIVTNGDTSDATDINTPLSDLEADANAVRPVVSGGTGASSEAAARTALGLAIGTNVQAFDADLSALAGLASTGLVARTGAGTVSARTVTAGAAISVTNGDGVSGNPTVAVSGLTTTEVAAGTLVTAAETVAANDTDTTIPTSSAVYRGRGYTWMASQSTGSGTSFDFTGIPSWASEIVVVMRDVSLSGTDNVLVQLGDSGGVETSGYNVTNQASESTNVNTAAGSTSGFSLTAGNAANAVTTAVRMYRPVPATPEWIADAVIRRGVQFALMAGWKQLTADLDRVRVTRTGTDTFDGGYVVVGYR